MTNAAGSGHFASSTNLEVFGRFLSTIAHDLVLNGLAFIEGAQSCTFDSGNVDEHVLATALRLNETIPLGRIEPFHRTCSHRRLRAVAHVVVARASRDAQMVRVLGNDLRATQNGSLARQTENL